MNTDLTLTESQNRAEQKLEFFIELQAKGIREVNGISSRPFPLLISPSGTGKTYLVNRLARRHKLPLFSINVPNWIPRGARAESQITVDQIRTFVETNSSGIILLDEVNKLTVGHTHDNAWSSDIFGECLAVLDQDARLEAMGMAGLLEKFRRHFLIVGAAAFQDEWLRSGSIDKSIGFGEKVQEMRREVTFERLVRTQQLVPEELLFRFNDRLIVIAPPTASEFADRIRGVRSSLSLERLGDFETARLGNEAVASGKMMRWIEGYLSDCLSEMPVSVMTDFGTASIDAQAAPAISEPRISPIQTSQTVTKLRDIAFGEYESSLHGLARAAVRMCAICDSVLTGVSYPSYTPFQEKLYEGMNLGGGHLGSNKTELERLELFGRALRYISCWGVRLGFGSVSPERRAEYAGKIQRFSFRLSKAFQIMMSQCSDYSEAKPFFDAATEFIYCAENASAHLEHLRTFDPPSSAK